MGQFGCLLLETHQSLSGGFLIELGDPVLDGAPTVTSGFLVLAGPQR